MRQCEGCGILFQPSRSTQRFHTKHCSSSRRWPGGGGTRRQLLIGGILSVVYEGGKQRSFEGVGYSLAEAHADAKGQAVRRFPGEVFYELAWSTPATIRADLRRQAA